MTTIGQLRKAALALPETTETTRSGAVEFQVRARGFASVSRDRKIVHLRLRDDDAEAALADHPAGERLIRAENPAGFSIGLAEINGQALNYLVRRAWDARAPQRLAATLRAADAAVPGTGGDLPASIGAPATRALAGAGITTIAAVAERSEKELLALHGVGPKAIRILADELQGRGLSFG